MNFAVIPAAGQSRRMGRPKLSLPLGHATVLEHAVGAFRAAGVESILVIVAPGTNELKALAQSAGALVAQLPAPTADMRATVEAGLDWLQERFHPSMTDGWFLSPADHPTLAPSLIGEILAWGLRRPQCSVLIPCHAGKRGHPAWLRWSHVQGIREFPRGQGLNSYLRQQESVTGEVAVVTDEILRDLDTPEDYERLCLDWQHKERIYGDIDTAAQTHSGGGQQAQVD